MRVKNALTQAKNADDKKALFALHVYDHYRHLQAGAHPQGKLGWFWDKLALCYWYNLI